MDMGEAIDMEYIDFRKLSKQAGAGSSHSANQDYGLRKLEKCILMAGCSEYQTDSEVKPEWWGRGGCVCGEVQDVGLKASSVLTNHICKKPEVLCSLCLVWLMFHDSPLLTSEPCSCMCNVVLGNAKNSLI